MNIRTSYFKYEPERMLRASEFIWSVIMANPRSHRFEERNRQFNCPTFNPGRLLDECNRILRTRNDLQLSMKLGVDCATMSKLRHRRVHVTAALIVAIMDATGLGLDQIREYAGIPRSSSGG